jgi:hypothetical protein
MTDEDFPGGADRELDESALRPLDDADIAVLAEVNRLYAHLDSPPEDLVTRIQFALALDEVFSEVAHITRLPDDALATRNDAVAGTRTETLTFSAERLTAMVTVSRVGSHELRIDGWIAPATALEVRLRMQGERRQVMSDETGRFVIDRLPEGFAQLSFHPADTHDESSVVVTPLFQL